MTKMTHILNDPLLDKTEKTKLTTDHVLSGQTYGAFVIANFEELFEDNFSCIRQGMFDCIADCDFYS